MQLKTGDCATGRWDGGSALRWRCGFTLIEMLVSLAVLTLALSVVGVIFAVTTKTAGQAAAYSETLVLARQFLNQIQEDLRHCDPSQSILVLVGRTQAAARTQEDLEAGKFHRVFVGNSENFDAGYDPEFDANLDGGGGDGKSDYSNPRADLLMFFTNRPVVSQAPPIDPDPYPGDPLAHAALQGVKFTPSQIVYGHAALADAVLNGTDYNYPTDGTEVHIEQTVDGSDNLLSISRIPANQWHLSRRQIIVSPYDAGNAAVLSDATFVHNQDSMRYLVRCEPREEDDPPGPGGSLRQYLPGDMGWLDYSYLLWIFDASSSASLNPFQSHPLATVSPYDNTGGTYGLGGWGDALRQVVQPLLYRDGRPRFHHVATVLREVPVDLRGNMGVHLLPGCAWFQVEFLMPEDPRNSRMYCSPQPHDSTFSRPSNMLRWTSVEEGQTYLFVPDTAANRAAVAAQVDEKGKPPSGTPTRLALFGRLDQMLNGDIISPGTTVSNRLIRMWPYAIRVTVHVYDGRGRLEQPIIRSIVHRFD